MIFSYLRDIMKKISTPSPQKWEDIEYFKENWKNRISRMARLIRHDEKSVVDLGCGQMWLKAYLTPDCTYYGCDYRPRDTDTIVCDFNKKEFPDIRVDVAFVSGCLEYVEDVPWFIKQVSEHCKVLILSYCTRDVHTRLARRKKNAWVNHYWERELLEIAQQTGYVLDCRCDEIPGNLILRFAKK